MFVDLTYMFGVNDVWIDNFMQWTLKDTATTMYYYYSF